jgi:hypothetical protein
MGRQKNGRDDNGALSDNACAGRSFFCHSFFCHQIVFFRFSVACSLMIWRKGRSLAKNNSRAYKGLAGACRASRNG